MRNLQKQVKKTFCIKNCIELSLFQQIVLVIFNILQILGLQSCISKVFLTVGQNNLGNKISFAFLKAKRNLRETYIQRKEYCGVCRDPTRDD